MTAQRTHDGWLEYAIGTLIEAPALWRRAYGLSLASFAHFATSEFEQLISRANVAGTWVEDILPGLRRRNHRDVCARAWMESFLSETEPVRWWAAFEVAASLADRRLLVWYEEVKDGRTVDDGRLRLVDLRWNEIERTLERTGERQNKLFDIETKRGQVFPFMT